MLADAGDGEGIATAMLDMARIEDVRSAIFSLEHDRPFGLHHIG
ncbi:MAG TPA: hypothetical protein VE175_15330 [Woeseiaceae bacterium]|nr:hypothetical protein [Woeseiaceae bacterium]